MSKVALFTNFLEFNPGYSLTGIVLDQARMLAKYRNDVTVFVSERYHGNDIPGVQISKTIPGIDLIDYQSVKDLTPQHAEKVKVMTERFTPILKDYDFVFTHDFVFTGWNLPFGLSCRELSKTLPDIRWMHWIHSVPSMMRDWWFIRDFPQGNKLIYPNETDRIRLAEQFRGDMDDVRVIPHIRDIRSFFDFKPETMKFLDDYPHVMQADIVQVYPCSSDRLDAKRLDVVIKIFGYLKQLGYSVCLVVANQHATGLQRKQDIQAYIDLARQYRLHPGTDIIITSLWDQPKYETGVPKHILRELMQCGNLFIFPTREETFGLVLPEASLASGCLCVLNLSLQMQSEISGCNTIAFNFGSFDRSLNCENMEQYLQSIAMVISSRLCQDDGIKLRTYMRQKYNMDYLYKRFYAPIMAESENW